MLQMIKNKVFIDGTTKNIIATALDNAYLPDIYNVVI